MLPHSNMLMLLIRQLTERYDHSDMSMLLIRLTEEAMRQKTERVTLLGEPEFVTRVDDWSFANRVRTRAEAIRQLVEKGLEAFANEGRQASETQNDGRAAT